VLLSDRDIRSEIDGARVVLDPWDPAMIQPSSVDVRLDKFFRLTSPSENPYGSEAYGSHYQGQRGPTASRSFQNFHRADV
jgi:deoxycytidine triphosphate deaminase